MAASEAVALLETLRAQAAEVAAHGREMLRRVRGGQLDTKEVLEKLRPLEQRLKHHLEKLLRAAASGGRGAEDPLSFRPAPSNMAAQGADEEDEGDESDEGRGGGAKAPGLGGGRRRYVPPRLVPVSCDPPSPGSRSQLRSRRRALSSAVIRELREELGEGPLEVGEGLTRTPNHQKHRVQFEESMLQRLSAPWRPRRPRGAGPELDDVTKFGAFPALLGEAANQESSEPAKKKRKKQKMGKRKGKRGFRRRR
ncbi:neuroguidin isoform X2 [Catharus ustulatus]|uniref:neuroguidin isoform X2 n=1 Tax=Catharus ustulatus TaxID=91951 RepID=UPI0014098093|nr:neuroguidin isoform X2 [Catharus ustulatus]